MPETEDFLYEDHRVDADLYSRKKKSRTIAVYQILAQYTDSEHPLSAIKIVQILKDIGIQAERKAIYEDVRILLDFQVDVVRVKGGFYLGERILSVSELKLLVDAIQSARFISRQKSDEIIKKLTGVLSTYQSKELERQVFVEVKTENVAVLSTVDHIHKAIHDDKKIKFYYVKHDEKKNLIYKKNKRLYLVSPFALIWKDDNYYLVGFSEDDYSMRHYRVDRMMNTMLIDGPRIGKEYFDEMDLASYSKSAFGMFRGEPTDVTLLCDADLADAILDRFGNDVYFLKGDREHSFRVNVHVMPSPVFYSFLFQFGNKVRVLGPDFVIQDMKKLLKENLENYT